MIKHIFKIIWNKKGSNALMLLEIFLSFLVLFFVVSYVIYNMDRLALPLGFETENKWIVKLDRYNGKDSIYIHEVQSNLKRTLSEMPYVQHVAFSNSVSPYSNNTWQTVDDDMGFTIETRYASVDEDFMDAMNLKLTQGRFFSELDLTSNYKPVIVSERFLDMYFPGKDMIDSTILIGGEIKIIGAFEDYRYNGQFEKPVNTILYYQPHTDRESTTVYLDLAEDTPKQFEEEVNNVIESITKTTSFVIQDLSILKRQKDRYFWIPIIALLIISGFLCINVALGLFGVMWYSISKRRGEIGLRRALGASPLDIAAQFTMEIIILCGLSIVLGVFFAIQVPILNLIPIDPSVFYRSIIWSTLIILAIVTICALYPSRQASQITPATALHEE